MKREDREMILIAGIIIIVSSISLVAVLYFFWQLVGPPLGRLIDTVQYGITVTQANYNFAYPGITQVVAIKSEFKGPKPNRYLQNSRRKKQVAAFLKRPDYGFPYPNWQLTQSSPRVNLSGKTDQLFAPYLLELINNQTANYETGLVIEVMNTIKGNIFSGYDSEQILKRGFWIVPGSKPLGEGGVIIACYRRYLLPIYSQSCWDIDQVRVGQKINIYKGEDLRQSYEVVSIENTTNSNRALVEVTNANSLKLLTSDPLGSTGIILIKAIAN